MKEIQRKFCETSKEKDTHSFSNLRKALCREWYMSGVLRNGKSWGHGGKSTMNRKPGCSCGMLVLSGSNASAYGVIMTNKMGKVS